MESTHDDQVSKEGIDRSIKIVVVGLLSVEKVK